MSRAIVPIADLTAAEKAADRCGITLARRALHREFPGITERRAVDQALANRLVIR